jgi:hypothetical protein
LSLAESPRLTGDRLMRFDRDLARVQIASPDCVTCDGGGDFLRRSGDGGRAAAVRPRAAGAQGVTISSIACPKTGNCVAVGSFESAANGSGTTGGAIAIEHNGAWAPSIPTPPTPGQSVGPGLDSVACDGPGECVAGGSDGAPTISTETQGNWTSSTVIQTPYGSQGDIESVACPSAGSCVAVGYYTLPATPGLGMYGNVPLVATQVNGVWQPATSPGTPGDLHTVTAVTLSVATPGSPPQQASAALRITVETPPQPRSAPPALRRLRVSPVTVSIAGRWIHGHCVAPSPGNRRHPGCRRPARLTLSYVLSSRATLRLTLARRSDGRIARRRCVAPTRSNRRDRHCERWTSLRATASFTSAAGTRRRLLPGALVAGLKPGRYRLTTTPTAGGTSGRSVSTGFQIVG